MGVIAEKDFIKFLKDILGLTDNDPDINVESELFSKDEDSISQNSNIVNSEKIVDYEESGYDLFNEDVVFESCIIDDDYLEEYYNKIENQIEDEIKNKILDEMDGESISYKGLSKSTIAYLQDKSIKTKGDLLHYNPNILKNKNYISDIDAEIYKLKDLYNIERKKRIINKYLEEHPEDHPEEF